MNNRQHNIGPNNPIRISCLNHAASNSALTSMIPPSVVLDLYPVPNACVCGPLYLHPGYIGVQSLSCPALSSPPDKRRRGHCWCWIGRGHAAFMLIPRLQCWTLTQTAYFVSARGVDAGIHWLFSNVFMHSLASSYSGWRLCVPLQHLTQR